MIAHVATRIGLVALGYVAGLVAAVAAFFLLLTLIGFLVPDGGIWDILELSPIFVLAVPFAFVASVWLTGAFTLIPALVVMLASEALALQALWLHLGAAVAVGIAGSLSLDPLWFSGMSPDKWLISLAAIGAALVSGIVYWLIAGRRAGFRRAA